MFKVGDRVVCNPRSAVANRLSELRGVVVHISGAKIGVDWGEDVDGHTCEHRCKPGFGWYVNNTDLRKVIVFKGNK